MYLCLLLCRCGRLFVTKLWSFTKTSNFTGNTEEVLKRNHTHWHLKPHSLTFAWQPQYKFFIQSVHCPWTFPYTYYLFSFFSTGGCFHCKSLPRSIIMPHVSGPGFQLHQHRKWLTCNLWSFSLSVKYLHSGGSIASTKQRPDILSKV